MSLETPSLPSTSRQATCPVCKIHPTKYTCPGCSTPTCSLSCSKGHKTQSGCSGQRNKVAYVPMNKYGWGQMMGDYTYLEEVGRRAADWKGSPKDRPNFGKGKGRRELLQSQLQSQGIDMDLLPMGMSRRKLNQSSWDMKSQTAYLTVEIKTHVGTSKTSTISHRHRLNTPLGSIIDAHPTSWCTLANEPVDLSKTLGDALAGKSFVEYPSFDLWEERPRKLGAGAIKGILGGYESAEEEPSVVQDSGVKENRALSLLGAYDSDSEASVAGHDSEVEVDWGDSDGESGVQISLASS